MEQVLGLFDNGVTIAVLAFFMWQWATQQKELTSALNDLKGMIQKQTTLFEEHFHEDITP